MQQHMKQVYAASVNHKRRYDKQLSWPEVLGDHRQVLMRSHIWKEKPHTSKNCENHQQEQTEPIDHLQEQSLSIGSCFD